MIGRAIVTPVTATVKVVRVIGAKRVALLGTGAAIGALLTPVAGPELRRRVALEIAKRRTGTESTIEDRVRKRLASSPRTWHLDQPEVVAVQGDHEATWKIILAGVVPDASSRDDFTDTAQSVAGVASVDNRMRVASIEEGDTSV